GRMRPRRSIDGRFPRTGDGVRFDGSYLGEPQSSRGEHDERSTMKTSHDPIGARRGLRHRGRTAASSALLAAIALTLVVSFSPGGGRPLGGPPPASSALLAAIALTLVVSFSAGAAAAGPPPQAQASPHALAPRALLDAAKANPRGLFNVVVQGDSSDVVAKQVE